MSDLPLYTIPQFARLSGISEQAVRDKIHNGELVGHKVGDRYLITAQEATRFLTSWPSKNRGTTARWRAYREYKAAMLAAASGEAA
jgi:excisionase family DNA binding protein